MDLAPGAALTFTILAIDNQPANTFLQFQVNADSTAAIPEVNESNNMDFVITGSS